MLTAIALAALALRAGLALRRARRLRTRRPRALLDRHLSVSKPAVVLALTGFAAGPLSMWLLRGRAPFETAHALAGVVAVALFAATGWLGRRLARGDRRGVEAHARLGLLAVLVTALSAITGFVLLP